MLNQGLKLNEVRIQERNRIAKDLHDGILGKLFGIRLGFGFLKIKGEEKELKKFNYYLSELQKIEKELRSISHDLRNEILSSNDDFESVLSSLIKDQNKIWNYKINLKCDNTICWNKIDETIKINIYRIAQEALQNINKHSNATKIKFDIAKEKSFLIIVIEDNGIGFQPKEKNMGIGIDNIGSRVKSIHGNFTIKSTKTSGTKLTISIPVKD